MLQFLQPISLWATAGIIVPILIHLWNRKQGKTLKVGSIALLTGSVSAQAKRLRLSDVWLLLLRCLLLIVLAMLMAKPVWKEGIKTKEKGWLLVPKSEVKEAYKGFQPLIDTLLKQGYAFHYFNENFTEGNWQEALQIKADTAKESSLSYWALLKLLNEKAPTNLPVYLFTDNYLQQFWGNRPIVSLPLKWYTYSSMDTSATWLEKAYETTSDSLQIVKGKSHTAGTYFTHQTISLAEKNSDYSIHADNGKLLIAGNDSLQQIIEADTSTILITIYENGFAEDANYLQAVIAAIKDFTQYKIKIITVHKVENIPAHADWLFWLSDEAMPASKIKNNVFVYEPGKPETIHSALLAEDKAELTTPENIALYKYIKHDASHLQTIWKNGFDEPLLSRQTGDATIYHFYSRFNPQWSDLVWSHTFPQLIYYLIFDKENSDEKTGARDKRIIDATQIQPHIIPAQNIKAMPRNEVAAEDVSRIFWFIAFFLFATERILSFVSKGESYE